MKENREILKELKKCPRVVAYLSVTNTFVRISKKSVINMSEHILIDYYITDDIYANKWRTLVIL